jgi:hypothetical protein
VQSPGSNYGLELELALYVELALDIALELALDSDDALLLLPVTGTGFEPRLTPEPATINVTSTDDEVGLITCT